MKIFEINIPFIHTLATLRPILSKEYCYTWDNWDITNNYIADFIPTLYSIVGKADCLHDLYQKFNGIELKEITIKENPLEEKTKNKKTLKWLPINYPKLLELEITSYVPLSTRSTVSYDEDGFIEELEGVDEVVGGTIIKKREAGKGFFIKKDEVNGLSFFKPLNSNYPLCTEDVKKYIEKKKFSNILFLEVGEII